MSSPIPDFYLSATRQIFLSAQESLQMGDVISPQAYIGCFQNERECDLYKAKIGINIEKSARLIQDKAVELSADFILVMYTAFTLEDYVDLADEIVDGYGSIENFPGAKQTILFSIETRTGTYVASELVKPYADESATFDCPPAFELVTEIDGPLSELLPKQWKLAPSTTLH